MRFLLLLATIATTLSGHSDSGSEKSAAEQLRFRPIAAAFTSEETHLLVASESRGSIAVIDLSAENGSIISQLKFGIRSGDLVPLHKNHFLVSDMDQHRLYLLRYEPRTASLRSVDSYEVAGYPHNICVGPADHESNFKVAVCGLWSRQISLMNFRDGELTESFRVDLDFSPGPATWLDGDRILVADAFSDQLALLDARHGKLLDSWRREGHRIGGICVQHNQILATDIRLNKIARSVTSDIHWGLMVSNQIYGFDRQVLVDHGLLKKSFVSRPIGGPSEGKGDPSEITVTNQGKIICVLQGVGEIAIGDHDSDGFAYLEVGSKPVGLMVNESQSRAVVCNSLDDTVHVIHLEDERAEQVVNLGGDKPRKPGPAERGEKLFFDSSLSHDSWISCNTCHVNGHTNSMLNDNLSDQTFGTPKQVISLLGASETLPLAWNGGMNDLATQIASSIETTMRSDNSVRANEVDDLTAYLKTLAPPPSVLHARNEVSGERFARGQKIFEQSKCITCHVPDHAYTSNEVFDVALRDEQGEARFNPPTLRGLSQRERFFHDGRAENLKDVLVKFAHPSDDLGLDESQLADLLYFLNSI